MFEKVQMVPEGLTGRTGFIHGRGLRIRPTHVVGLRGTQCGPLLVDDIAQGLVDLGVDAAQVIPPEALLSGPAQPLEDLPDALEVLAVDVEALVEHPTQGRFRVTVLD